MLGSDERNSLCSRFSTFASNADAGHTTATKFQATGGDFAKLFNVQNKKFVTISCRQCGYTELYRAQTGTGMNVLDFLVG